MQIIGLSGYARSGKDEAAKILVEEFGFTRVAFADKLREVLYALDPLISPTPSNYYVNSKVPYYLSYVINRYGWDDYKETEWGPEIRRLLQRLGTEAGREILGQNIWVDAAFNGLPDDAKIVVTDVRFPNEAKAIKSRDGTMVRVNRQGVTAINAHPSETSLDNFKFDYTLTNAGTLEQYKEHVRGFVDAWGTDEYFKHVIGD